MNAQMNMSGGGAVWARSCRIQGRGGFLMGTSRVSPSRPFFVWPRLSKPEVPERATFSGRHPGPFYNLFLFNVWV